MVKGVFLVVGMFFVVWFLINVLSACMGVLRVRSFAVRFVQGVRIDCAGPMEGQE